MRPVSRGRRGKEVLDIQTRLQALGFGVGREGADGHFGPKTEVAVRSFQQRRLLLADGIVGENTWTELVEAGYQFGERLLYLRQPPLRGDDVLELQRRLNRFGFDSGREDGIFGRVTEEALMEFQRNAGINVDAIVGESTLDQLRRVQKAGMDGQDRKIPDRMEGYVGHEDIGELRVCLDPGRGGPDTGARGPRGLLEKDVNLALAMKVRALLEERGVKVHMTRTTDEHLGPYERATIANQWGAEIVLALHHNHLNAPKARGAATYYFANGTFFTEAGKRLAGYLVKSFVEDLGRVDLHTHGRNYACLREIEGLSVLVEPAFVTNPDEATELSTEQGIEREARAILRGLEAYLLRT